MNIARIDAATGAVVNIELWAEVPEDTADHLFRELTQGAGIGCTWDGEAFVPPTPPDAPAPLAPAEVAMHKVHKAALLTPWDGHDNLKAAIEAAFEQLPAPSNTLARIEWDKAPNLVRDGATTAAVVAILGMTEAQRDELLIFAATLP